MADEPDSLVLESLRRFDAQLHVVDAKLDRLGADVRDLSVCMTRVERRLELIDTPPDGVRE